MALVMKYFIFLTKQTISSGFCFWCYIPDRTHLYVYSCVHKFCLFSEALNLINICLEGYQVCRGHMGIDLLEHLSP